MKNLILLSAFCVLLFSVVTRGQDVPQNWVRVESKSKDFSIALPEGEFLVDHDGTKSELWYTASGRSFSVRINKVPNAKAALERSPILNSGDPNYRSIESGDFVGRWTDQVVDRAGRHSYWFNLASSNGSYLITANVNKGDEAIAERFIRSLRLDGRPLMDSTVADAPETNIVSVEQLEISDQIKDALTRPARKDLKLEIETTPAPLPNPYQYSRGAIVIRRPVAGYTEGARRRRVSGSVALRVTLLANGTIGSIVLTKSLDKDLDQQAFEAARQIKFLPAELDGKPVDTTLQIMYSFSVY